MKDWNTDKIVGAGLVLALLLLVIGNIIFALYTEHYPTSDIAKDIALVLGGYMGKDALIKKQKDGEQK